jgi:hypothetical protein
MYTPAQELVGEAPSIVNPNVAKPIRTARGTNLIRRGHGIAASDAHIPHS